MSSNDGRTSTRLGFGKTFNLDSLGHDVRRNLVKVDPRLPEDLKNVALLLKEERNILSSLQNIAQERKQASICLYNWGKDNSEDVADITEKMSNLMSKMSDVETVMAEKYEKYRNLLKDIREAEQRLLPAKERRRKINEEMSKTIKTHPRSPRIRELEAELEQVNRENAPTETDVGNLVRRKLKEAYTLLLDATFETSERLAIIAGFGGYIIGQLDANPVPAGSTRPKYTGDKVTSQIVKDCQIQLHNWQPPSTDIGPLLPTLTNTAPTLLAAQKEEYEAKLAQVNAEMTSQREAHEKQILEQTAKYDELAQSTFAKIDELTRTTSARIEELTSELENQKQGYKAQLDDMANALSSQREAYEKQVGDLTNKLSEQQKKSEQDLVEIRGVVATEKQKNEVQLREYQTLLTQKHEYEVQLRERDNSISKLQNDMNVVATEKGKLSQLVKDLEETLKSKSSTLSQKEEKINKLEDDITGIKSQLAGLKIASPAPAPASPASGASTSTVQGAAPARSATAASVTSSVSSPPVSESSANSAALPPPLSPANPHLPPPGGPFQQNTYDPQGQPFYNQQGFQPQQPFYQPQGYYGQPGQPGQPGHPQYAFQGQPGFNQGHPPPPPSPQQQQQQQHPPSFVGGFYLGPPDDAPPAYEPPADGVIPGGDEKKK